MTAYKFQHQIRQDCPLPAGTHVVAYMRDSGGENQDRSVSQQTELLTEYCERHGLILENLYADTAKTASNADHRSKLNEMIEHLHARFEPIRDSARRKRMIQSRPFGVVFFKSSRIARDIDEIHFIKSDLRRRGITLLDMFTTSTGDSGVDTILEAVQAMQDENALTEISQQVKRGLIYMISMQDNNPDFRKHNPDWPINDGRYLGIFPGTPPTGFQPERIQIGIRERTARISVSPEPRIVQRIVPDHSDGLWERCHLAWEMRRQEKSLREIMQATRLFKSASGYSDFFQNRIYTGDFEYGGLVLQGFVPALIPREWWEDEQRRIEERGSKRNQQYSVSDEPKRVVSQHLLSGLLYCSAEHPDLHVMNVNTRPANNHGTRPAWNSYICARKKGTRGLCCHAPTISANSLEKAVVSQLMATIFTQDNLSMLAGQFHQAVQNQAKFTETKLSAARHRQAEINRVCNRLIKALGKGRGEGIILEHLAAQQAELDEWKAKIMELEGKLAQSRQFVLDDSTLASLQESIRTRLEGGDILWSRKLLARLVDRVTVSNRQATIYYTFPRS